MGKIVLGSVGGLVLAACLVYLGDWGVWRVRGGMGTVSVSRFVVAPLKGNKEEYYPDGTSELECSKSIFRQAGSGACWWMVRHPVVFDR